MKKLLLIFIAFLPLIGFAQFEGGEYINADTSKISGQPLIYAAPTEGENYYTKMRDPSDSLDGVNLRTLFRRIAELDSLGILVTNIISGNQIINTGTTNIAFETPFDSMDVTVVPFVRRLSDEAVVDYRVDDVDKNGFNVTVWEDNVKLSYVASEKNPKSNAFFNNILLKSDTSTISIDTSQVKHLQTFVENHSINSAANPKYLADSSFIKTGVRLVNSKSANWSNKSDTTGQTLNYVLKKGAKGYINSQIFDNGTNIGIGTISPTYTLDLYKNTNSSYGIRIKNVSTSTGAYADAVVQLENSYSSAQLFKTCIGYSTYKTIIAQDLGFYNNSNAGNISILNDYALGDIKLTTGGATTTQFILRPSGNVGIGTTTPLHKETIVVAKTTNLNGLNIVNSDRNKNRTTIVQACDTSNVCVQSSSTGNLTLKITDKDGLIQFQNDSAKTAIKGDVIWDFVHAVGSADSLSYTSSGSTQNIYYKINTTAFVSHEADGITIAGDSMKILTAGDYKVYIWICATSANANDKLRIRMYKNNAPLSPSAGRFIINSQGTGNSETESFMWYQTFAVNDWLSWRIANLTGARASNITDFKIYIEKVPEN